jgi:hypothetical protein
MNRTGVPLPVTDPPRRPLLADAPPRTAAAPPARPIHAPDPAGGRRRLPEPPVFRTDPLTAPRACVNCATPVGSSSATPRCWGCGRALCTDCYWRHGLVPSAHRCTSCLVAAPHGEQAVSGGRAVPPRTGFTPAAASTKPP